MIIKTVRNLNDFVVNGIQSQEQTNKCSTCDLIGQMQLNKFLVSLQVWMSSIEDKVVVNGEEHRMNDLFFHVYDKSVDPKTHVVLVRFFNGSVDKVPAINEKSDNDLFQVTVNLEEREGISMSVNGMDVFSGGSPDDLICALSGQDDLLKVKVNDDGHVIMPISKLMLLEPTADLVLRLWHKVPEDQGYAVEMGKSLFNLFKSIYQFMKSTGNIKLFDPGKCYMIFVESSYNGTKYRKIGIVNISNNKPQYVIIPEMLYDSKNPTMAAVSSATNKFQTEIIKGTLADVRAFFGGIKEETV